MGPQHAKQEDRALVKGRRVLQEGLQGRMSTQHTPGGSDGCLGPDARSCLLVILPSTLHSLCCPPAGTPCMCSSMPTYFYPVVRPVPGEAKTTARVSDPDPSAAVVILLPTLGRVKE